MKYGIPLGCLFSASILLTACQTSTFMSSGLGMRPTNGQIVKDVMVADHGEIATAKIATHRSMNRTVRRYATYLYNEHTRCAHKIAKLAKKAKIHPEDSAYAKEIHAYYADEKKSLEAAPRREFDKTYINATIKDHQHALDFIDRSINDSTNEMLTADLKKARVHIANHLAKAQHIKQQMGY